MDKGLLEKIKKEVLSVPFEAKQKSRDFAGFYVHSNKPFSLEEHEAAIHSFFVFSNYCYPLYLFISLESITDDLKFLLQKYPLKINIIPKLNSIYEYSDFLAYQIPFLLEEEHLIHIHPDGFLIKSGWENETLGYGWLGAKWKYPVRVIENTFNFGCIQTGNGIGYRSRSKIIQVLNELEKFGGQHNIVKGIEINGELRNVGSFLAEDLLFCYFGFGMGIFKPVDLNWIDSFAIEPIEWKDYNQSIKPCYFFHRIDE